MNLKRQTRINGSEMRAFFHGEKKFTPFANASAAMPTE